VTPFRTVAEDPVAPPAVPAEQADLAVLDFWHRQHLLNQQGRTEAGTSPEAAQDLTVLDSWHRQHLLNQQGRTEAGTSPKAAQD
jgi:hypothetical protein